jgi:hypothetical protein
MAASSLTAVEVGIAKSRRESSVGNYTDALHTLTAIKEKSNSVNAVHGEIIRIHIILGDHETIALSPMVAPAVTKQRIDPYDELLFIQIELSRVSTSGELTHSLQSATSLFQKYRNVLDSEGSHEGVVSCHENAFEIGSYLLT